MAYIDTSVLAAYYCPERLSAKVQKVLARLPDATISPLVELEFLSALATKVRAREFDAPTAGRIASTFQLHLADGLYRMVPIEAREYALARLWIGSFAAALRTLDALHLAAASANDLVLLTADKGLARAAVKLNVRHEILA